MAVANNVLGNSLSPTLESKEIDPKTSRIITIAVPVKRTNGPLTSFLSQRCPAHLSVFVFDPSPTVVTLQAQTKHVRPDLVASRHFPRPEHELVAFVHESSEGKQVEMEPIGCCGGGRLGGRGDCEAWGRRLASEGVAVENVRSAMCRLSGFPYARSRKLRISSTAFPYSSLVGPYV